MAQPSILTASIAWIDSANDVPDCWHRSPPMIEPLQRRSDCNDSLHPEREGACNANLCNVCNVCIVHDPSEPLFDSVQSVISRPVGDEGAQREERSIPGMQWVGRVKSVAFDVGGKPGQPPYVRIWSNASGTHARFSHGFWHYTLDGDRLVKRDVRRALRIAGAICYQSSPMFLGYRNCSVNHFGSYVWHKAKTITQLKISPVRFKAIHLPGNRQGR